MALDLKYQGIARNVLTKRLNAINKETGEPEFPIKEEPELNNPEVFVNRESEPAQEDKLTPT